MTPGTPASAVGSDEMSKMSIEDCIMSSPPTSVPAEGVTQSDQRASETRGCCYYDNQPGAASEMSYNVNSTLGEDIRLPTLSPLSSGEQTITSLSSPSPFHEKYGVKKGCCQESSPPDTLSPDFCSSKAVQQTSKTEALNVPSSIAKEKLNITAERERAYALYKAGQAHPGSMAPFVQKTRMLSTSPVRRPLGELQNQHLS